jgi:hypothetical protein
MKQMTRFNFLIVQIRGFSVLLMFALLSFLLGCNGILLTERQKVVKHSQEAVCKESDFKAMRPYVSKNSIPILELSSSLTNLSQIFLGSSLSDRIAIECHSGEQKFVDEIKVNDERYIVRTKNSKTDNLVETVVILEDGVWKIALLGR